MSSDGERLRGITRKQAADWASDVGSCTAAERALLDAIASGKSIVEARRAVAIERTDPVLFEAAVQAELAVNRAREAAGAARDAYLGEYAGRPSPEFDARWDALYAEVARR